METEDGENRGECRVNAPVVVVRAMDHTRGVATEYPVVSPQWTCRLHNAPYECSG